MKKVLLIFPIFLIFSCVGSRKKQMQLKTIMGDSIKYWSCIDTVNKYSLRIAFKNNLSYVIFYEDENPKRRIAAAQYDIKVLCESQKFKFRNNVIRAHNFKWELTYFSSDSLTFRNLYENEFYSCRLCEDQNTRIFIPYCNDTLF